MKGTQLLSHTKSFLKRSSPTILTCVGVAGVIATSVMAVKATPKALRIIEENTGYNHDGVVVGPSKKEIIALTWHCYIPATLMGLSTIVCIVGINALNKRNQASLASAYAMLSESYQHYRGAAKAVYGEDADSKIKAQVATEKFISGGCGYLYQPQLDASEKILFYDDYSMRYFTSTMAGVINAQYHFNRNLALRGYISLNEFYEFLGIDHVKGGDNIGWNMDNIMEGGYMWLDFENEYIELEDGLTCYRMYAVFEPECLECDE